MPGKIKKVFDYLFLDKEESHSKKNKKKQKKLAKKTSHKKKTIKKTIKKKTIKKTIKKKHHKKHKEKKLKKTPPRINKQITKSAENLSKKSTEEIEIQKEKKRQETKEEIKKLFAKKDEKKKENKEEKPKKKSIFARFFTDKKEIPNKDVEKFFQEWGLVFPDIAIAEKMMAEIKQKVSNSLKNIDVRKEKIEKRINFAVRDAIDSIIAPTPNLTGLINSKKGPFIIMLIGYEDCGKTTAIAKIGNILKKNEISSILSACDTSNTESMQELERYAKELNLTITRGELGYDPSIIAAESVKYASSQEIKCVLIDTAGNLDSEENQLNKIKKIVEKVNPDLKLFVGESTKDETTIQQAKTISEKIGIDGFVITKADLYEETKTVIMLSYITKKPVYFISSGENLESIQKFDKENLFKKLKLG